MTRKKAKPSPEEMRKLESEEHNKRRAESELRVDGKFSLHEQELAASREFIKDHQCTLTPAKRSIRYVFTDAGVGTNIIVQCTCGASKDVSAYDLW